MKKIFLILLTVTSLNFAQFSSLNPNEGNLGAGFGMSWIDNNPFYTFKFNPEIAFANMGIGLDLNLEFSPSGQIRTENFNEVSDYLSIIRYFRYGQKGDPVYFRVGALDYATLGHGSIMYLYNNSPTFDARRVGVEFDLDMNQFGFELVYGNFLQSGVVGLRGYTRPLKFTSLGSVPVLGNLEVGATFVNDFNTDARVTAGVYDPTTDSFTSTNSESTVAAFGFDLGLPIVKTDMVKLDLYYDFAQMLNFGNGSSAGLILQLNGLGLVNLRTKFERRLNNDQYIPSYFGAFYELERFSLDKSTGAVSSKIQLLKNATTSLGNGWYGELLVTLLGTFDILGSYQRLDDHPDSGILHLSTDVSPKDGSFVARAGYDKINIRDEKDLFTLDDRSYLFAELGYKPMPYIVVSMVYNWTFTPVRDADDNIIDYAPQKKIEPRVSFVYPFNL
ncbi:MAG: hypothetical protein D6830_06460 [Ignavibacteria bacterium]|nr:MAG: hypothetical protein D6830_06460 [Ignavibacteria bacterium]